MRAAYLMCYASFCSHSLVHKDQIWCPWVKRQARGLMASSGFAASRCFYTTVQNWDVGCMAFFLFSYSMVFCSFVPPSFLWYLRWFKVRAYIVYPFLLWLWIQSVLLVVEWTSLSSSCLQASLCCLSSHVFLWEKCLTLLDWMKLKFSN